MEIESNIVFPVRREGERWAVGGMATLGATKSAPSGSTLRHPARAQSRKRGGWEHMTAASAPILSPSLGWSAPCSRDPTDGGITQ